MTATIYCRTTDKGEQTYYYAGAHGTLYLFKAAYRKSNKEFFRGGRTIYEVLGARQHHSFSVRNAAERILSTLKFIEREQNFSVFDRVSRQEAKKQSGQRERARKACRGKVDLSDYALDEVI